MTEQEILKIMRASGFKGHQLCSVQAAHPGAVKVSWETREVWEMHANFMEFLVEDFFKTIEFLILDLPVALELLNCPRSSGVDYFARWQVYL